MPDVELPSLLIWGTSGHAKVVAEIVRLSHSHRIAGFIDDTHSAPGTFQDLPVYASPSTSLAACIIIAVGDCRARLALATRASEAGFVLATAIHPRSIVSAEATLSPGIVVAAGAVINPGCQLGENVIINTGATVDHDCIISEGAHIGPGVHIGGWVAVGRASWLGIGAIIRDRITIGCGSIVGAGAVVIADLPGNVLAYGVPAKFIRTLP